MRTYCYNIYPVSESLFFAEILENTFLSHYLIYMYNADLSLVLFLSKPRRLTFCFLRFLDKLFGLRLRIQSKAAEQSLWHTFNFDFTKGLIPMWSFTLPIYSEGGFPHCISNG